MPNLTCAPGVPMPFHFPADIHIPGAEDWTHMTHPYKKSDNNDPYTQMINLPSNNPKPEPTDKKV